MKKLAIVLLLTAGLFTIISAQSGRRVQSTPAPIPTPSGSGTASETGGYSESAPNKTATIYARPSARDRKEKSKNKSQPAPKNQTLPETSTAAPTDADEDVLKIETNLITIPVSVYEHSGIYVSDLRQSDFKVFEDGKQQEVAYFGATDTPFTVILLIDVSPSTAYKIEEIRQAATAFVDQLKPQDSVMVIEFAAGVHVLTELTGDRQKIYKAINHADFGDGTSLYDAVDFSLRKRLDKIEGRKAIVLFTDGVDTSSHKTDFEETVGEAEESNTVIFPIYYNTFFDNRGIGRGGAMSTPPTLGLPQGGMNSRGTSSADYTRGRAYLEALAAATGGRMFRPESTPGGLTAAFEGIAGELHRQYSIGYYPSEAGQPGQRKQIKVRVNRPNVAVRARDSYIVGADKTPSKTAADR